MVKESKFNFCSSHKLCIVLSYYNFHQKLSKEDLVNNGDSLFSEEVILKPQYPEEFVKSFKFSL